MRVLMLLAVLGLGACTLQTPAPDPAPRDAPGEAPKNTRAEADRQAAIRKAELRAKGEAAARQFVQVVRRMEPVAEQVCREKRGHNCDFKIVVDDRRNQPPNAFQTLDRAGQPVLVFNLALIGSVRNADELAFVVGHEAAHHIADHLSRIQERATIGSVVGGVASVLVGGDQAAVRAGQELGALVGARSYSKNYELEADALGTVITRRAGFDPLRGAQFFTQLPDPGNKFLGTHPPNKARMDIVRKVARGG